MPAVSEKQRRLFSMAAAMKKGRVRKSYSAEAKRIAQSLSVPKIREFTQKVEQ